MSTLPVSAPAAPGPLKVALLSLPERTEAVLEFFFSNNGGLHFLACAEGEAEAAVFDLDTAESRAHWAAFHARTGHAGIALSVTPQAVPDALWVRKPVTPAAMIEAAAGVRRLQALPAATTAVSNVVTWPRPLPVDATVEPEPEPAAAEPASGPPGPLDPCPPPALAVDLEAASCAEPLTAPSGTQETRETPTTVSRPPAARTQVGWWRRLWLRWFGVGTPAPAPFAETDAGAEATARVAPMVRNDPALVSAPEPVPVAPAAPTAPAPLAAALSEPSAAMPQPIEQPDTVPAVSATQTAPTHATEQAADAAPLPEEPDPVTEDEPEAPTTSTMVSAGSPRPLPDDEAVAEARWCGPATDRPLADFDNDRQLLYRRTLHLVGALGEATLVGRKWQVPTQLDLDDLRIVVDVRRNLLHVAPSQARLKELQGSELPRRVKTRTLSHAEAQDWEQRRANEGETLQLDQTLWCCALDTAAGRLPDDLDRQAVLYLRHWPNLTRLPRTPHAMRIAALWATRGASLADTVDLLRVAPRHVVAFCNAARALDLITEDGSHIRRAQRKGGRNRGALTRLLGWLHR